MNFSEIEVIPIKLDVKFKSNQHLNCLFFQPKIEFKKDDSSKRCLIKDKDKHFNKIKHLILLSKDNKLNQLGNDVHFILLPEYAIGGIDQVNFILNEMSDSTISEQILIGGIDGLLKGEFINLLQGSNFDDEIKNDMITWIGNRPDSIWINTGILIQKKNEEISYYLQPKLKSSPLEAPIRMLEGKWILFFSTSASQDKLFFFFSICFDWIANEQNGAINEIIPQKLGNSIISNGESCIAFVPQCNDKPEHNSFIESTKNYLVNSSTWSIFHKNKSLCFIINSAISDRKFGMSSVIINDNRYNCGTDPLPTYSIKKKHMENFRNVAFRNQTECIHAIELVLPSSTTTDPGSPRFPCTKAIVHTVDGEAIQDDPRFPNPPSCVCGYRKVINDFLDIIKLKNIFRDNLHSSSIEESEKEEGFNKLCVLVKKLRNHIKKEIAINILKHSFLNIQSENNCDKWQYNKEGESLSDLVSILALFKFIKFEIALPLELHGSLKIGSLKYNFVYISSQNYSDNLDFNLREIDIKISKLSQTLCNNRLIIITENQVEARKITRFTQFNGELGNYSNCYPIYTSLDNLAYDLRSGDSLKIVRESVMKRLGGGENV